MKCKNCGKEKEIVNKHFGLCRECNNERLYGNKYGKRYKLSPLGRKSLRVAKKGLKTKGKASLFSPPSIKQKKIPKTSVELDEEFYEKCFNNSNHKCEECGCDLPTNFRDENGKINARFQYSHVLPKSTFPKLRYDSKNINMLCLACHAKWENGDKKLMKIYKKNKKNFPNYLE